MKKTYLIPLALALGSCCGVSPDIVATSRAIEQAIAPRYSRYVSEDPSLSLRDKQTMLRTIEVWRKLNDRLEAEAAAGEEPQAFPEVKS